MSSISGPSKKPRELPDSELRSSVATKEVRQVKRSKIRMAANVALQFSK